MNSSIYEEVFEASPEAMLLVQDGCIARANSEAARLLCRSSEEEIEGLRIEMVIPIDIGGRGDLRLALDRLAQGDVRIFKRELSLPGAFYLPVKITVTCLSSGTHLLMISENTEMLELKKALHESEENRRAILKTVSLPLMSVDRNKRIIWANDKAAALVGCSSLDMAGRRCHEAIMLSEKPCQNCPLEVAFRMSGTVHADISISGMPMKVSATSVRGSDGSLKASIMSIYDPAHSDATVSSEMFPGYSSFTCLQEGTGTEAIDASTALDIMALMLRKFIGISTHIEVSDDIPVIPLQELRHLVEAISETVVQQLGSEEDDRAIHISVSRHTVQEHTAELPPGDYLGVSLRRGDRPDDLVEALGRVHSANNLHRVPLEGPEPGKPWGVRLSEGEDGGSCVIMVPGSSE